MDTVTPLNVIIDELTQANELFRDVALGEGGAALLVLVGTLIIVFSLAVFGYLTLGALVNVVVPE